jgi:fructose-bisphosphate aldolase class II
VSGGFGSGAARSKRRRRGSVAVSGATTCSMSRSSLTGQCFSYVEYAKLSMGESQVAPPGRTRNAARAMPLADRARYSEMLDAAAAGGYAYAAVNVTSSQTLHAAMRGLADARADGIVEITTGGASYLGGGAGMLAGARALAAFAREVADGYDVLVALHTDHCPPQHLDGFLRPLLAESRERVEGGGEPLFVSQMFDGSSLPLEENLAISAELLATAGAAGVILEIEVGEVGGAEDDVAAAGDERLYTDVAEFRRVAEVLGTGERGRYLLAPAFGNAHGIHSAEAVELRTSVLHDGQAALSGGRFDYVFHGSSGSPPDVVEAAIREGVVKINVDTQMQLAFSQAVAAHVDSHHAGLLPEAGALPDKAAFDPRSWGRSAEAAMAATVVGACETYGSAGRTLLG